MWLLEDIETKVNGRREKENGMKYFQAHIVFKLYLSPYIWFPISIQTLFSIFFFPPISLQTLVLKEYLFI